MSLHPDVLEVAAFGVPSELSEDDVMVAIVARPGHHIDPVELVAFCETTMARHMVPRYIEVVDALPKTPTEKVEKYRLAARGPTTTTWDRERGDLDVSRRRE
jgi:crotonobetaine/carnitine-CoA ligase